MIVTRTPLRISLGGGGTDLPAYYTQYGGEWISAAVDKYVYVAIQKADTTSRLQVWYYNGSVLGNEILNSVLKNLNIDYPVELMSSADLPPGSGLGSSSSFTVGLVRCFVDLNPEALADKASNIEMSISSCGKQDHYAAAIGGINHYEIDKYGKVDATPIDFDYKIFNDNLILLSLNKQRRADDILYEQQKNIDQTANYLHKIRGLGALMLEALEDNDFSTYGQLMDEHWREKKKISSKMSDDTIDELYSKALASGARGGKVIGAGGGGFLLLCAPPYRHEVIKKALGLESIDFKFDFTGCRKYEIS
jgi:D-glycero-alpha-D-manno-heptose-7-phosphate kinase